MSHPLKDRLTYANVTATIALFVALGGTSYAAITLPRNSVGSAQIRTAAVTSSDVRDRALGVRDLSLSARRSFKGGTGVAGPAGPKGDTGAAAVRYFAAVSGAGALVRGSATSGGRAGSAGMYVVGFPQAVNTCGYTATLGAPDGSAVAPGRITLGESDGKVLVRTYDEAGASSDLPFFLAVSC